jgi:flagellar M-ring protein FliF
VLLRLDERWQNSAAQAVRHMVASAVPGMKIEQVNVAATDGRLLASGGDELTLGTAKHAEMERSMAVELEQRASRTLSAVLGPGNYQVSATVRLDVDRQQVNETVFDPKSRIERSVRTVKQSGQSEDSGSKPAVGVVANLPKEESAQADGEKRRQREDRREELVNYELNTKTTQTVREGYRVKRQAIAVVISRKHLAESLGGGATPDAQEARLTELKRLVAAATGSSAEREDLVEIAAVDLTGGDAALAPVAGPGIKDYLMMNAGTAMNALAMLGVVFLVVWFGLRPVTRVLSQQPAITLETAGGPALEGPMGSADLPAIAPPHGEIAGVLADGTHEGGMQQLPRRKNNAAMREKLEALVESDSAEVTKVLKGWMQNAKAT